MQTQVSQYPRVLKIVSISHRYKLINIFCLPFSGTWETTGASGLARGVNCGGVPGSGVTHANSDAKPSVTLLWSPPSVAFSGKVVFVATVVKDYKTYWVSGRIARKLIQPTQP